MTSIRALASLTSTLTLAATLSACEVRSLSDATPPCQRCHGGDGLAAPPLSVHGLTETTERAVGAHRQHLADGPIRAAVACDECHVVPTRIEGHFGDAGSSATITWNGTLARAVGATPAWDPESATCAGVYCHGATLAGGDAKVPVWTRVDGSQRTCGSCHGFPPPSHASFRDAALCSRCHPRTVNPDLTIDVAGGLHVNGALDLDLTGACDSCHDAPPDTGAHRRHANPATVDSLSYGSLATLQDVSPAGGTSYEFGCGHCHPLDPADHLADVGSDGLPDVVLSPAGAGDRLKARNDPTAAWDPASGTCSGVACHSSGQETPSFAVTPPWTAAPGVLGCDGCHGNPPQYASGGAGAPDANSHVDLDDAGWEWGHFAGLPGVAHNPKHGGDPSVWGAGQAASPITCQACHFETVDPSNVRPGGFFYLDTSGDYAIEGGGDPSRFATASWQATQCSTCHDGVLAPLGAGAVLPLRHVNGVRDVAFDRRAALPPGYPTGLPALASPDPVRPYYVTTNAFDTAGLRLAPPDCATSPVPSCGVALDVELRPLAGPGEPAITLSLEHAAYDPATKTCSSVACHLERQHSVDTDRERPLVIPPLRWGAPYSLAVCANCHLR